MACQCCVCKRQTSHNETVWEESLGGREKKREVEQAGEEKRGQSTLALKQPFLKNPQGPQENPIGHWAHFLEVPSHPSSPHWGPYSQEMNVGGQPYPSYSRLFLFGQEPSHTPAWASSRWSSSCLAPGVRRGCFTLLERAGWIWRAEQSSGSTAPACQEKAGDNRTHFTLHLNCHFSQRRTHRDEKASR